MLMMMMIMMIDGDDKNYYYLLSVLRALEKERLARRPVE